jgi:hypothetical protein
MYSIGIGGDAIAPLYRMCELQQNQLTRPFMFHWPFELRHMVGRHRYGIPGFPCLYLGGSLQVCQAECRVPDNRLAQMAVAEFAPRHDLKVLDFGYRPSALAQVAAGSALRPEGSNPPLENILISYSVCWPLQAGASIRVLHEQGRFYPEYIVPQIITQWLIREADQCDGIRYFSTRYVPDPDAIRSTANFVFPARELHLQAGHCGKLKRAFDLTQPCMWASTTGGANVQQECHDNARHLSLLQKDRLT